MNLWTAVTSAKYMHNAGRIEECKILIAWAEAILWQYRESTNKDPIAICCYTTETRNGKITIWCTKRYFDGNGNDVDEGRLCVGTPEERPAICRMCRVGCEQEIKKLRTQLKSVSKNK